MAIASNPIGNNVRSSLVKIPPIDCLRGFWVNLCVMGTIARGNFVAQKLSDEAV